MHLKHALDGLVCLSVSVDDIEEKDKALAFLKKQSATLANYLIDEPAETWQTKLDASAPPTMIVIGRDGKRIKRFTGDEPFTYDDVRKVVDAALKAPG